VARSENSAVASHGGQHGRGTRTLLMAGSLAYATALGLPGAGSPRARSMGNRTQTASSPKDKPVHPNDLLAPFTMRWE